MSPRGKISFCKVENSEVQSGNNYFKSEGAVEEEGLTFCKTKIDTH